MITIASGADVSIEAYLGDTINLHGTSYFRDRVYLFMTGPNLPDDGVTLTDVTQRADQGQFTIIELDSNQQWSMKWNTARIERNIKPGTYIVYVTTEPVDRSHLGPTSSYKTLSVYLKDPGTDSKISIVAEKSLTLNPEEHSSTVTASPALIFTSPTPTPAPITTVTTITPTPLVSVSTSAQKTAALPLTAVLAVLGWGCIIVLYQQNRR